MKAWGPDMPPRNHAAAARDAHRAMFRAMLSHHARLQARSAADGLLDAVRTAGVVLAVLAIIGFRPTSFWLVSALIFAPQLFGLAVFAGALYWRRRARRIVDREVR